MERPKWQRVKKLLGRGKHEAQVKTIPVNCPLNEGAPAFQVFEKVLEDVKSGFIVESETEFDDERTYSGKKWIVELKNDDKRFHVDKRDSRYEAHDETNISIIVYDGPISLMRPALWVLKFESDQADRGWQVLRNREGHNPNEFFILYMDAVFDKEATELRFNDETYDFPGPHWPNLKPTA